MYTTRLIFLTALVFGLFSCSEPEPEDPGDKISQLIAEQEFEQAFDLLGHIDEDTPEAEQLEIEVHLAYANYLTHEADHITMGERMADALRHYRKVLELDEDHDQARALIELIEGIYEQMGRDVPQGVAD